MNPIDTLKNDVQLAVELLIEATKREWEGQGKKASGRAMQSIEGVVTSRVEDLTGIVLVEDYMEIQDRGVPASRIAFTPRRPGAPTRGGRSQLIESLVEWSRFVKPGLSEKERLGFAFAVATTMSREGMPTRGSVRYSPNGRNLYWSRFALEAVQKDIENIIQVSTWAQQLIDDMVTQING